MEDATERVGQNVKQLRESRYMSQAGLAAQLARRGVPGMHPQTIAKIESGIRALKFTEAVHLAAVLEVQLETLAYPGESAAQRIDMEQAATDVNWALAEAKGALRQLEMCVGTLRRHIADAKSAGVDIPEWVESVAALTAEEVAGLARADLLDQLDSARETYRQATADLPRDAATGLPYIGVQLRREPDNGEHQETP